MVKIRKFNPQKDLLAIAKMANSILNEEYKLSMFTNVYESWQDGFLLAESDGKYLGAIISILSKPNTARILVLVVHDSYRRQGIASKMLTLFIQKAVLIGVNKITLEVRMSNKSAINFYTRNRFKIVSTIPVYYKDGEGAFIMERNL